MNTLEIKNLYLKQLSTLDVDEGLVELLENIGFFSAPATSKYHHSFEGGLCLHSVEVANLMVELNKFLMTNIDEKSLIKIGLLHDISKSSYYELSAFNKKVYSPNGDKYDEIGNYYWSAELGYRIKEKSNREVVGNPGFHSYIISKDFVNYSDEEIIALNNYNDILNSESSDILTILSRSKLMLLLHLAKTISSYLVRSKLDDISL